MEESQRNEASPSAALGREAPQCQDADTSHEVQTFAMDDDVVTEPEEDNADGQDSDEVDDPTDVGEMGFSAQTSDHHSHRLSFMFEHNNLINMRMQNLASDIRCDLLSDAKSDDEMVERRELSNSKGSDVLPGASAGRNGFLPPPRQQKGRKSLILDQNGAAGLSADLDPLVKDGRANDYAELDALRSANEELRKRIAELEGSKPAEQVRSAPSEETRRDARSPGSSPCPESAGAHAEEPVASMPSSGPRRKPRRFSQDETMSADAGERSFAPASAEFSGEVESRRRRREIADLHAKVLQERTRCEQADKESAGLRRDLKKCKQVIERLVRELDVATRELTAPSSKTGVAATRGSVSSANNSGATGSTVPRKSALKTVSKTPAVAPRPAVAAAVDSSDMNKLSFMSDLNSAIGTFFGKMGMGSRQEDNASEAEEDCDQFCWCLEPTSKNIKVSNNNKIASFIGQDKASLHAFVATVEPPLLEADLGYGFEVLIQGVRSGYEDGMAIGFTATPPEDWPQDLPESADLIESTWLVGYNGEMYDGGTERWAPCSWSSVDLKVGDRVGAQVSFDGKLHIVVNHKIVWSAHIPISRSSPPLYGMVDLLGNTDEVMLLD